MNQPQQTPQQQQAEAFQRVMNRNMQDMLSAKDMQIIALKSQLEMLVPQIEALQKQVLAAKDELAKFQPSTDAQPWPEVEAEPTLPLSKPNGKSKEK